MIPHSQTPLATIGALCPPRTRHRAGTFLPLPGRDLLLPHPGNRSRSGNTNFVLGCEQDRDKEHFEVIPTSVLSRPGRKRFPHLSWNSLPRPFQLRKASVGASSFGAAQKLHAPKASPREHEASLGHFVSLSQIFSPLSHNLERTKGKRRKTN